jgi:hypothetical protein
MDWDLLKRNAAGVFAPPLAQAVIRCRYKPFVAVAGPLALLAHCRAPLLTPAV